MTTKSALYTITHFSRGAAEPKSSVCAIHAEDVEQYSDNPAWLLKHCMELATAFLKENLDTKFELLIRPALTQGYPGIEVRPDSATEYSHAWVVVECQKPSLT